MITLTAQWISERRKARNPPNPAFPDGLDLDISAGRPACSLALDYPAPCVGAWLIKCALCGMSVVVAAAGRPDDPRAIKIPCLTKGVLCPTKP